VLNGQHINRKQEDLTSPCSHMQHLAAAILCRQALATFSSTRQRVIIEGCAAAMPLQAAVGASSFLTSRRS